MIRNSKIQSQPYQKNKLSLNASKSRFSITNKSVLRSFQQKKKQINFKNFPEYTQQNIDPTLSTSKQCFPLLQIEKQNRKETRSLSKRNISSKQSKACRQLNILRQTPKRQNLSLNFPSSDKNSEPTNEKQHQMEKQKLKQNNRLRISLLFKPQKTKNFSLSQYDNQQNTQNYQNSSNIIRRNQKYNNTVNLGQHLRSSDHLDSSNGQKSGRISNFQQNSSVSKIFENVYKQKMLLLQSNVIEVCVKSQNKRASINIKSTDFYIAIQQKQRLDYLRYKRRKQQLQTELQDKFDILETIRNDRVIYQQRIEQLINSYSNPPINQRQKRVFRLKEQMIILQNKVHQAIIQKVKSFQAYIKKIQKCQDIIKQINTDFLNQFQQNFEIIKSKLQIEDPECQSTVYRIQSAVGFLIKQIQQEIQVQVQNSMPFKIDQNDLRNVFQQYNKSINEFKGLLKNCFGHIKKIPQMCHGLYGNTRPKVSSKSMLINQKNQFQMPKCMDCFKSQWKSQMVIQRNILMESILKVSEELFRT